MRAFVLAKYKQPLEFSEVEEPEVGERDVLIRVEAVGLNQLDEKIRAGEFAQILPYALPVVLGNDVAGTVIRVGRLVGSFRPGDRVFARPDQSRMGAFAERIAVAEADLALAPESVSTVEAGSLPLVALTAWQALVERGHVGPGHKVLIHAGAGGVGSIAIQLAKHLGAIIRRQAARLGVAYEFLFMRADGDQLSRIAALVDDGALRPIVAKTYPFEQIPAALTDLAAGGGRGKIVATFDS
jgi:NADPH:quinone reductase-like Zn-dependent oxidoreductase